MGKGDRKTKRGKVTMGSYGKRRPRKDNQMNLASNQIEPGANGTTAKTKAAKEEKKAKAEVKKAPAKKVAAKKPAAKKTTKKED